ncbi:leucine-rich repeat serine/threonine-protein kinase 1 isoform X2 [Cyprinodon tularosa]|uniref:leucine-rich repeat serine/threonine-protein kinase 1 isoform X2 n=1 Tax=Cyprinodon tularosa TaxID=77115 RepID=UPI0018E23798|nr:leucine-rich repeat serine/threonine-protein kinase 1 isoform X2 [Cyprinodon tularosa]
MSYWAVGVSQETGEPPNNMEQTNSTGGETEAKVSLVEAPGPDSEITPSLENIKAAYEGGDKEAARELIQQACCVDCSGGIHPDGVRLLSLATQHSDIVSVCYLLKEARIPVPQEPSLCNPAVLAAHCGFSNLLKELLDSIPILFVYRLGVCLKRDLVNCLLATACQQGHLEVVRLLVHSYEADVKDFALHSNEFAVLCGLPLYAAAQASNEEIAHFLIENGAEFSSYTLMDYPDFSKRLLRQKLHETTGANGVEGVGVYWSGLQLPFLELDWIMDVCSKITHLDLSSNSLSALPSVVPWGLIHLKTLDLSSNALKELPFAQNSQDVICCRLQVVTLSHNQLKSLPTGLLHLTRLQKLSAANNQLTTLFDIPSNVNWIGLRKLEVLDVSGNSLTSLHTSVMHCLKSLRCLDVSRNRLRAFPEPWACPLRICKASSNIIENLPNTISIFWRTQLQEVDFSDNCLKELPSYIFELEAIMSLKLCGNLIETLPAPNKWKCSKLKTLDLSRNVLGRTEEGPRSRRLAFLTTWNRRDPDPVSPIEFPGVLRDSLEVLTLNDNQLECVPQSLCGLRNLTELYLSNNPGIRELPAELGQLSNLWQLDIDNLNITNIPQAVRKEGSASVLAFLRAQLRKAEPCRLLKMLVVGPPRQGKSALVEALLTGKASPFTPSECSISTFGLELEKPNAGKNNESIMFNLWDIGGPASMTTVNQCFFTDKSLYVVIWNLALGEEAVANLQTWLLNIEARAPNSAVVVVGTHLDLIDTKFRTERLATLRAYVLALCRSPSGARAAGYPDITFKHLHEVSCKTLEGLEGLKTLIYQVALSMKDSGSSACGAKLLGRLIPRSYFILQEAVIAEKERRDAAEEVQYLTDAQLLSIIEQNPESDIRDYEDLQTAISFLIETGTLLHFPDTSHGLCTLYFLCPVWLSDCLERIVHLNSCRPLPKNGLIQTEQLRKLLEGTGFTRETEEQYFQFLAKFEIALPVANNRYLLPHLLPPKPAMDIHGFHHHTNNTLQRLFKMSFVPAGFWERFIARMLISLTEMDLQSSDPLKRRSKNRRSSLIYSFAGSQQRNRCSTFRVRRSQTIYWKEGLLVTFDGGYLSVESSDVNWKKIKSGGIKIICQSDVRDFSAMAFITDHVNSLIEQWFPALTGSQNDGSLLIEQYVPCSLCAPCDRQQQDPGEDDRGREAEVHYFNMEDCVLAAVEKDSISCPQHPEQPVPLQELVPELFMTDFPARLFLDKAELQLSEEEKDVLGQGGSGTIICRATYKDQPVAVKHFHFKRCRQLTVSKDSDTVVKHLEFVDVSHSFSEFRQEASILHCLQHPCIVSLVGISIHPLCFALQLAPLGSLNTVLEEKHAFRSSDYMPLGYMLTFKVAYQVAAGLAYLHRKNIIFCDLKSDNMLVWSLELQDPINIKLSDYGISRQSFHEGALGVEGTPGYQAPEVRPGIVYDEKVDMFSYGMVLYELLSGRRPALGNHQLQIAKKLSRGVRPVLGSLEEVQFYSLHTLMTECWDTKPEKRPMASRCVRQMEEPSFPCLRYLLSCDSQSQLFLSQLQGYSAVFWNGDNEERNYSVVNVEKAQVEVKRMCCPGNRISCQMKMRNSLWMATEEQEVFIYSLKDMCPLSQPQKRLSCPAVVTSLFHVPAGEQNLAKVFAGMSDGLVAVYTLVDDLPLDGETYLCSHTLNKTIFGLKDSDPRQRPYPVRSMALVSSGSQLWFSNGPGLLVINTTSLQAVRRLEPYRTPSSVISMTTSFSLWGEEAVWTLDDTSNTLLLYYAASYELCASYCCGDRSPLRDVFDVLHPAGLAVVAGEDINTTDQNGKLEWSNGDVTLIFSEEAGTQIIQHQDSVTDYCSLSSTSSLEPPESNTLSTTDCSLLKSRGCLPLPQNPEDSEEQQDEQTDTDNLDSAEDINPATPELQAFNLLPVNGTLWIPRRGGDIIIIEMQPYGGQLRGRVTAVLAPPGRSSLGTLQEAALVAKDTVVCGFQQEENMEWCLVVWRAWGSSEISVFYQSYEELYRSESNIRIRR